MSIPLTIDMSGYAYDVNNPTQYTERLSYALFSILDSLETAGYQFDFSSLTQLQSVEADIAAMQSAYTNQEIGGTVINVPPASTAAYSSRLLYATLTTIRERLLAASSGRNRQPTTINIDLSSLVTALQTDIVQAIQGITPADLSSLVTALQTDVANAIWGVAKSEGIITIGTVDVWSKSQVVEEFH